tara:strand:+ start:806 stop:1795 length:990 start_codon:yes stop_codon:yes gene_type:complete
MKNKKKYIILIYFLFSIFFISCDHEKSIRVIRLGHGLDVNHSVHLAMLQADKYLDDLSKGKMRLRIYPNQQLGTERECLELLQIGSLDMTKVSAAVLENFAPKLKIFGLPFLFENKEHFYRVLDGPIGIDLLKEGDKYWLKGMGYYDSGSRSFYTRDKFIQNPNDLRGLKIRVQESATAFEMVSRFGASPTPISWGELYTSIQQGLVDGAENNIPSFYLSKHYEVCKYFIFDEHNMIPDVILSSTHLWKRLSPQEQNWLQKAINLSIPFQRTLWVKSEQNSLKAIKKAGVMVSYPDKKPFQKAIVSMYENFKKDPEILELIKRIENEKK